MTVSGDRVNSAALREVGVFLAVMVTSVCVSTATVVTLDDGRERFDR